MCTVNYKVDRFFNLTTIHSPVNFDIKGCERLWAHRITFICTLHFAIGQLDLFISTCHADSATSPSFDLYEIIIGSPLC